MATEGRTKTNAEQSVESLERDRMVIERR